MPNVEDFIDKARRQGYSDEQINSFLKKKNIEPPEESGFIQNLVRGVSRPFWETGKRVLEAGYQTGLTALPGSPTEQGSLEQQARLKRPTFVMEEEQLADRGKIIGDTARTTAGLAAYAVPTAKAGALLSKAPILGGRIAKGALTGGAFTAGQEDTGVGQIALGAGLGATGAGLFKYLPKALHPFRTVGQARTEAATQTTNTVSGDKILSSLKSTGKNLSPTQRNQYNKFLEVATDQYKGKQISMPDALKVLQEANKAFGAAGKVGKSATASFNKALGDSLRHQIGQLAPEVAKANRLFEYLYTGKGAAKKLVYPVATGAAIGAMYKILGLGGNR
jgi:hypothetical protein